MDTRQPAGDSASHAWPRLPNNQGWVKTSHCQRDRATWGCVHALGSAAPVTLRLIVTLHPHVHSTRCDSSRGSATHDSPESIVL